MNAIDDEQVDILRIRLWSPAHATALLAECHAADRVLAQWAGRPHSNPVGFEVTFVDGHTVRGCHAFYQRGKRTCLFGNYLRKLRAGG